MPFWVEIEQHCDFYSFRNLRAVLQALAALLAPISHSRNDLSAAIVDITGLARQSIEFAQTLETYRILIGSYRLPSCNWFAWDFLHLTAVMGTNANTPQPLRFVQVEDPHCESFCLISRH